MSSDVVVGANIGIPHSGTAGRNCPWNCAVCVTVAVGGIRFVSPVRISDLVTVEATLVHTGTTSMQFAVDVRARDPMGGASRLCTHCIIVFVALDADGKGVAVPAWAADGDTDRRLADYAEKVMALSKGIEETVAKIVPEMT